ncbi:MAG TPA: hypothetical protein VER37_05150, partial [Thermomicrobiales bacterium]|nr:hypothetical protein [Thermomicrobiales bacterium]
MGAQIDPRLPPHLVWQSVSVWGWGKQGGESEPDQSAALPSTPKRGADDPGVVAEGGRYEPD